MICIDQILPTITSGDAVSNDTFAIQKLLRERGYKSRIYTQNIVPELSGFVYPVEKYKQRESDIVIYHMATGSNLSYMIKKLKGPVKIMIYHNITPARYFRKYNRISYELVKKGRQELKMLNDSFDYCFADSVYNKKELEAYGYNNVRVLPILLSFADYKKPADRNIIEKYGDRGTNILFVGRIVPNKKQEDVIKTFYYYKKYINKESRLFLVGPYRDMKNYYKLLKELVNHLELDDVYFTGHVPFDRVLAYYQIADIFLCMSEHEGFCVPLLESMFFEVPVIAYKSSAIPYTLGNAGVMVKEKNYPLIAEMMEQIINNKQFRDILISGQKQRLKDFSRDASEAQLLDCINEILGDINEKR